MDKLELGKYYDVTTRCYTHPVEAAVKYYVGYEKIYLCADTNNLWIAMVGYSSTYYINRDKLEYTDGLKFNSECNIVPNIIMLQAKDLIDINTMSHYLDAVLLMHSMKGDLWDTIECNSYNEYINIISNIFGIGSEAWLGFRASEAILLKELED